MRLIEKLTDFPDDVVGVVSRAAADLISIKTGQGPAVIISLATKQQQESPMSVAERAALQKRLDEFSARLNTRADEFRTAGEFSDIHRAALQRMRRRGDALRKKVDEAEAHGSTWDLMKAELLRDCSSLFDDLLEIENRLDSETMKTNGGTVPDSPR